MDHNKAREAWAKFRDGDALSTEEITMLVDMIDNAMPFLCTMPDAGAVLFRTNLDRATMLQARDADDKPLTVTERAYLRRLVKPGYVNNMRSGWYAEDLVRAPLKKRGLLTIRRTKAAGVFDIDVTYAEITEKGCKALG